MGSTPDIMVVNTDHKPGEAEEIVLELFKYEVETYGESRMTPGLLRRRYVDSGLFGCVPTDSGGSIETQAPDKQTINYALRQLKAAGWVEKVERGLYEFVDDPREGNDGE